MARKPHDNRIPFPDVFVPETGRHHDGLWPPAYLNPGDKAVPVLWRNGTRTAADYDDKILWGHTDMSTDIIAYEPTTDKRNHE